MEHIAPIKGAAPTLEDTLSASYATMSVQAAGYELDYGSVALANHLWFAPGVEATAGFRLGFAARLVSGYCFEGFGAIAIAPHFPTALDAAGRTASWRPTLGMEIGGTSAAFSPLKSPSDSGLLQGSTASGIYGAMAGRPLRFGLSSWSASVLGLTFGTMLARPGRQVRLQIELLQVGFVL